MDKHQKRYEEHQARKKISMIELMRKRYSERIFSDRDIGKNKLRLIREMIDLVPSSCNRKAIIIKEIKERDDKQLLGGLLVGGAGWIHRANRIILLISDWSAYKEGLPFMPFLDAGVITQQIYLTCTALNLGCCFVNPNIRVNHAKFFEETFMPNPDHRFCGALALGYKEK